VDTSPLSSVKKLKTFDIFNGAEVFNCLGDSPLDGIIKSLLLTLASDLLDLFEMSAISMKKKSYRLK
jgi:hypothetical protein